MDTRKVIENYYKYANPQDRARWLALFNDDIVLHEQLAGHIVGIDALTQLIAALDAAYPTFRAVPQHTAIDGDQACVIEHISTVTASGVAIEVQAASYFRVKDGKITYFMNVHDTAPFPGPAPQ
jgi:ketosteroid isomerase-like protein